MRFDILRRLKNSRGFSLVELAVATGIVMISLVGAGNVVTLIFNSDANLQVKSQQTGMKGNFVGELFTETNWMATYSDNFNRTTNKMECLYKHTDCSAFAAVTTHFRVVDMGKGVVYDDMAPSDAAANAPINGYTENGAPCSTYSNAVGNDKCPYHYDITWTPICSPGSCIDPLVKVHGTFHVNFATEVTGRPNSPDFMPMEFNLILSMKPRSKLYAYPVVFFVNWNANPSETGGAYTPFSFTIPVVPIANAVGAITLNSVIQSGDPAAIVTSAVNTISYTPKLNYYGMDFLDYTFTDAIGNQGKGRAWLKIVTPYTWLGDGANDLSSNSLNWCGSAKPDGSGCTHSIPGTAKKQFVFNQNCDKCQTVTLDALTDPNIWSIETTTAFKGTIKQNADLVVESGGYRNTFSANPYNHQGIYLAGGTYDTAGFKLTDQTDFNRQVDSDNMFPTPPTLAYTTFDLKAGVTFKSSGVLSLHGSGMTIDPAASFQNTGTCEISHDWARPSQIYAPNADLGNVSFINGWGTAYVLESPIKVAAFVLNGVDNPFTSVCGTVGNDITIMGPVTAAQGGGEASCGAPANFKTRLIMAAAGHQQILGVLPPTDTRNPGSIPNLTVSAQTTIDLVGSVGVYGETIINGTVNAGTSNFYLNGTSWGGSTLDVPPPAPAPHFYDLTYYSGANLILKHSITVDHDFFFDHHASVYGFFVTDKNTVQVNLKGDLHLKNGQMNHGDNVVPVNFMGPSDQNVIAEGYSVGYWAPPTSVMSDGPIGAPSILVNKPSGNFSIIEAPSPVCLASGEALCTIDFMGDLVFNSAASFNISNGPGTRYYFGSYWGMITSDIKNATATPVMDFGQADLIIYSGTPWYYGGFNFGNTRVIAHSVDDRKGNMSNVTFDLTGDMSVGPYASYANTGVNINFIGPATHTYSLATNVQQSIEIKDSGTMKLMTSFLSGVITIDPLATLDQNSLNIDHAVLNGNTTAQWITGSTTSPQNFTNSTNNFTGVLR